MIKRIIILMLVILGVSFLQAMVPAPGKCSGDDEYALGIKNLGEYMLIKDYRISLASGSANNPPMVSFPISLTAGLKYKFIPINHPDNKSKLVMKIFVNQKKEMPIASSYNSSSSKHYPSVEFECKTTGTFYLFFFFADGQKGCGVGLFTVSK